MKRGKHDETDMRIYCAAPMAVAAPFVSVVASLP